MGAHGRAALLTHIIDPNREVDPSFWQWNVTTKKGETLTGVIAGENASGLTLRNANGDVVVTQGRHRDAREHAPVADARRARVARAPRPCATSSRSSSPTAPSAADDQRFRIIDLREAYTADSRRGLRREDERDETVTLHRFGDVTVAGVPFFVMDPGAIAERRKPDRAQGRPGQRQSSPTSSRSASRFRPP